MSFKARLARFIRDIDFKAIAKTLLPLLGLAGILGFVARWVLPFVVGRAESKVDKELERVETRDADHIKNVEAVNESHKKIEAVTPDSKSEDIDDAIDSQLDNL